MSVPRDVVVSWPCLPKIKDAVKEAIRRGSSCVIIEGASKTLIDKYNFELSWEDGCNLEAEYQGRREDGTAIDVIPLNSNCPRLDNGCIRSTGINILIQIGDIPYVIMVKGLCPGGYCEPGTTDILATAIQDTQADIGIDLIKSKCTLYPLATVKLSDSYHYGIRVEETYTMYGTVLPSDVSPQSGDILSILDDKPSGVSTLHWLLTSYHLAKLYENTKSMEEILCKIRDLEGVDKIVV